MTVDPGFFLDPGVPVPTRVAIEHEQVEQAVEVQQQPSDTFAKCALSVPEFYRYIGRARKLGQLDPETELVVRETWLAAFKAGCRFSVERTAALSRPDVVEAIAVLAEVTRGREE